MARRHRVGAATCTSGGVVVADGELKMWARVVNHGGMLLEDGQIIADTVLPREPGTVEMVGPGRRTTA